MAVLVFAMLTACGSNAQSGTSGTPAMTEKDKEMSSAPDAEEEEKETTETPDAAEEEKETTETPDAAEEQEDMTEITSDAASEKPETVAEGTTEETAVNSSLSSGEASTDAAEAETAAPAAHSNVLVVFFSATGTTRGVAGRIASVTGGDLYEILAAEPYTSDDLNYNDQSSRTTKEQNDKSVRPEIGSEELSLEGYTTVYLGFPIWWGEEPRILDTFAEKYSFEGITVIPFCTSGGSGIGRSGSNMEALAGSGTWLEGRRFDGDVSEEELRSWIESLK